MGQVVPFGTGTFNSRSMALGGAAVSEAARKILALSGAVWSG